jgi:hypothetical protein
VLGAWFADCFFSGMSHSLRSPAEHESELAPNWPESSSLRFSKHALAKAGAGIQVFTPSSPLLDTAFAGMTDMSFSFRHKSSHLFCQELAAAIQRAGRFKETADAAVGDFASRSTLPW